MMEQVCCGLKAVWVHCLRGFVVATRAWIELYVRVNLGLR